MKKSFLFAFMVLLASMLNAQDRTFDQYRAADTRATHWQPVSYGTSSQNATIIGVVEFEGIEQLSNQLEVGVFYGDVCRGAVMAQYIPNLGRYYVFLTVFGNNGEVDTFKIYDHAKQKELDMTCSQTYTYHDDDMIGSIPVPYVFSFFYNHFEINVSADPIVGGAVSGGGLYDRDATVTLTATANYGYSFVKWTKNDEVVSSTTPYSVTATINTMGDYVAHFAPIPYEITATTNPTTGGTVTGGGTHNYGTNVTLTATPATGYHFVNWTKDGVAVSTNTSYSFVVSGDADYVANFELNSYNITVSANPTAGGTVTGAGTYNHFATCTLIATPSTGYHFVNWKKNGSIVSTDATYQFEVTGGGNYVANFEINSYTIAATANPTAGGTITGAGTYNHFATCTLTATPATGYHFVNWTKGGEAYSTNTTVSFEVTQAESFVANFEINSYEIGATANNAQFGSVSGAGTYNHFATCTLVATPATGYHFVNWTKAGIEVSSSATYQFEVSEAGDYVANFAINTYEITVIANPTAGGTVTGAGTYEHFANCTLTATPATGYHFVNWTKGGEAYSTDLTVSFEVTLAESFVANFEINSYEIVATANNALFGSVSGAGTYNHFETCTLVATPATGYHFVNWTNAGVEVSTSATYQFEVSGAGDYVANFAINTYEITAVANPTAGGTVTGAGTYEHFATCTLTATPAIGYHFVNWTKGGEAYSTDLTVSFEVTQAESFVANFEINSYEIVATANNAQFGSVSGAGMYNHFETCTLVATPANGYHFVNWTKGEEVYSTSTTVSFEVIQAESFVANFEINSYEIVATANNALYGSVSGAGTYNHFETCTLVATPATGYHFVNWTKAGVEVSTNATYQFEVSGTGNYVANFAINSYAITAVADPAVGGTVTGAGIYDHFVTCTLTATPETGYHFVNWTKGGVEYSTELTISFEVTQEESFVANFEINSYEIGATANNAEFGSVSGAGTYNHFETCTLVATPVTGYHFVNWTKAGAEVSTSATYQFEVSGAGDYVANFAINTYEITVVANPVAGGTVTGAGTYEHFATCTLTATPSTGYHFVNWTKGGEAYSTELIISFEVTQAESFVANFEINSYEIVATANNAQFGSVSGDGTYNHFETCTLVATPATGYHFVNWTKGGEAYSTNTTISFEVTQAESFVANFEINSYEIVATANNTQFGSVSGAGTYNHFETCTLVATPATGCHFVNWTKAGVEVSTNATYQFEVSEAGDYVANFAINTYEITVVANPTAGGTVTGAGTYEHFATCTLTAAPATGYHFVNWTNGGEAYSTEQTISFDVTQAESFVANFAINSYEIVAIANNALFGSVSGSGTYNHFETCTLVATPATGCHFVNWTKAGEVYSTNTTISFEVTQAESFVANFEINEYEITAIINPADGGTVIGAGTYSYGSTCTLTATAADVYLFVNWTKDGMEVSTEPSITFTVYNNDTYVANFIYNNYEITASASPEYAGTVTGAGVYFHNQSCTLTAVPAMGYHFVNWTSNGIEVSTELVYTFTVLSSAEYVANFAPNIYQVTLFGTPYAAVASLTGAGTYYYGQTCELDAEPNEGYDFVHWKKNDVEIVSTNSSYLFNVTENVAYVAYFALRNYEITATANPIEGGTVTGSGTYGHGSTCTLNAIAAEGYTFVNWTLNGNEVSTNATYTFNVTESNDYVANFSIIVYNITAVANPVEGGTVEGAGAFEHGSTCTLTATASEGYNFINWTMGGNVVTDEASFTITVTENADFVANFEEIVINTYEVTVSANPDGYGTVTGEGTYVEGETCTITATPTSGHIFVYWTENGNIVSEDAVYSFTVTENHNFVANFDHDNVNEISDIQLVMYPNPAIDKVIIESSVLIRKCEVYAINGALVYTLNECSKTFEINVRHYKPGNYVIRLISDSFIQTKSLIKE